MWTRRQTRNPIPGLRSPPWYAPLSSQSLQAMPGAALHVSPAFAAFTQ